MAARTLEQVAADLHVVIRESITGDLRQPEAGKLVEILRRERELLCAGGALRYDRARSATMRRSLREVVADLGERA